MSFGVVAEYLGWKPAAGVYGHQFADPVVQDLIDRRRLQSICLKRHSLEFNKKKLKIAEIPPDPKAHKPLRYPSIPVADITYVQQEDGRTDPLVFSLILLGYNEESSHSVHVHAWRGRSLAGVSEFVARLNKCLTSRDHLQLVRQRERQLLLTREVEPSGFFAAEGGQHRQLHLSQQPQQPQLPPPAAASAAAAAAASLPAELLSVTEELKRKLRDGRSGVPLLHPPRDYDTMTRSHGNAALGRTEPPLRGGTSAPSGAVIRRSAPEPAAAAATATADDCCDEDGNSSDDGDVADDAAWSVGSIGGVGGGGDLTADPCRGFSTWRKRRLQQMQQRQQMQHQHQQLLQLRQTVSIAGWSGFEPPTVPHEPTSPRHQQKPRSSGRPC